MKCKKSMRRMVLSIVWIVVGVVLNVLCYMKKLDDFWSGFGVGLAAVGVAQLIRQIRYRTNDDYREKFDTEVDDERNKFLSTKAWAWTGYAFIICCAVATIAFKIAGYDSYSYIASMAICLMVVIYWVSYMILKRKY